MFRLLILLACLSSCSPTLVVYTDYHTHKDLASFNVGTPDPALYSHECLGQSLVFEWFIPKKYFEAHDIHIDTYVRLRDGTEYNFTFPITCISGQTTWDLLGDQYFCSEGIFTFYAVMYADNEILRTVVHPLYTPLIKVGKNN